MQVLALLAGLGLLLLVLQEAFEVMLLPRRVQRRLRFVRMYFRRGWRLFTLLARRLPEGGAPSACSASSDPWPWSCCSASGPRVSSSASAW